MMTSLFSIFEPSSSILSLNLNWMSTFLGFLFVPVLFWASPSRWLYLWFKIVSALHNEFKTILGPSNPGL